MSELVVDPKRLEMLDASSKEFRELFSAKGFDRNKKLIKYHFSDFYLCAPPILKVLWRMRNWEQRALPAATVTGAIRSGTTSMANYFLQHPCIALPLAKELGTMSPKMNFIRAQYPLQSEVDALKAKYGVGMTVDCTPNLPSIAWTYFGKAVNPDLKTIIMLRNPAERSISHYRWNAMFMEPFSNDQLYSQIPDIDEAFRVEMEDMELGGSGFHLACGGVMTGYLRHSIYLPYIKRAHEVFGKDRVKVINASDFFANPIDVTRECYEFAGLPDFSPGHIQDNNESKKVPIKDETKADLKAFFKPYNERLYDYLGTDLGWD